MSLTRRSLMALAGFGLSIGLLVLIPTARQALFARFVSPVLDTVEIGDFFRLKVDVDYRGTPMPFDIVVSCNLRITRYRDFSRSVEASGLTPTLFGRVSLDGKKTVAVRPPVFCRGETTDNGQVPANFMPLMVVFPSTEWFDFAIAYMQDEAYESPLSDLKFHNATVHRASYEEFIVFRKTQPNAIDVFASDLSMDKPSAVWAANANFKHPQTLRQINFCYFWKRFRATPSAQEKLRKVWPPHRPEYWTAQWSLDGVTGTRFAASEDASTQILTTSGMSDDYGSSENVPDRGVYRRDHSGLSGRKDYVPGGYRPAAVYPDAQMWQAGQIPDDPLSYARRLIRENVKRLSNIDLRAEARGFAYCWPSYESMQFRLEVSDAPIPLSTKQRLQNGTAQGRLPYWQGVNDKPVTNICSNGSWALRPQSCGPSEINLSRSIVFESDEYWMHRSEFGLGVLRGKL